MSQFRYELIFEEKDIFLQDSEGRRKETFQKSDFLTRGGWYKVTESLLNKFSERLVIKINAPINVLLTFKAEINANVSGAIANANKAGAIANANAPGAIANANASDTIANANVRDAIANAYVSGATANANANGAIVKYFY